MESAAMVVDHGEEDPFEGQASSVISFHSSSSSSSQDSVDNNSGDAPTKCLKKRQTEDSEPNKKKKDKKKIKKSNDFGQWGLVVALPSDEPRKWIQRVWDENDEVAIFEGMIDYIENGGDPYVDAAGFLDSIRESLHFDPTVKMLKCKICKLKTKYDNIAKKRRGGDGEDPVFARPHELKCYGLWKEIWGPNNSKSGSVGIRTHKKKIKTDSEMGEDANRELSSKVIKPDWSMFPCLTDLMGLDSDSFQALCTPGGRRVIEKGNLRAENVKACLEWIDQLREKVMKIDKFLESSDSKELSE